MKRPPGLWLLLSAGVLWLSVQDVYCVKATSLIFGKTSTTTTDTPSSSSPSNEENASEASAATTEAPSSTGNVTKSPLTGIPQIDYIWDPNLPKELNGYNLTEYPFYERVPEDIDFKCDGLHDGFYASVPHKCQVYHHCLFGTRYDFLCANYTAFDQKTFICHFVSEVDCVNSKKFWHRNDALYKAAETTTTTVKPTFVYTPPPQPPPVALPAAPATPRRPPGGSGGRRQRPFRRRRPQYDYYDYEDYDAEKDDYYDDPRYQVTPDPPRRRKRPRPRPRPIYDDEYDDYEDDRYDRGRGNGRRDSDRDRRPYDRRGSDDRRYDDRRPADRKRNKNERRKYEDMDDDRYEDDTYMRRKRPNKDRDVTEERRPIEKRTNEDRRHDKRRPVSEDDDYDRRGTRKGNRKPLDDDYENDKPSKVHPKDHPKEEERKSPDEHKTMIKPTSGSSIYDRPRAPPKIRPPVPKNEQNKYAYKPISLKVPPKEPVEEYYDDYEEDIKKIPPRNNKKHEDTRRPTIEEAEEEEDRKPTASSNRPRTQSKKPDYSYEDDERDVRYPPKRPKYGGDRDRRVETTTTTTTTKKPLNDDYYDDYEDYGKPLKDDPKAHKDNVDNESKHSPSKEETTPLPTTTTTTTVATTTRATKYTFKERPDPIIRVVKRPFLPSRGGNPYAARGLQPVGSKAIDVKKPTTTTTARPNEQNHEAPYLSEVRSEKEHENKQYRPLTKTDDRGSMSYSKSTTTEEPSQSQSHSNEDTRHHNRQPSTSVEDTYEDRLEERPIFKPSPILVKVPIRSKYNVPINEEIQEDFRPVSNRPITSIKQNKEYNQDNEPRATHKPKLPEKNPLDINENEYDVTLNDALNPTLPNLPIRGFPTGFSSSNHYTYSSFQRPRYDTGLTQAGSDYSYQIKIPQQRYEPQNSYRNNAGPQQFVNTNADYTGQYTSLIAQTNQNYRPRITQAQTHAFYNPY